MTDFVFIIIIGIVMAIGSIALTLEERNTRIVCPRCGKFWRVCRELVADMLQDDRQRRCTAPCSAGITALIMETRVFRRTAAELQALALRNTAAAQTLADAAESLRAVKGEQP